MDNNNMTHKMNFQSRFPVNVNLPKTTETRPLLDYEQKFCKFGCVYRYSVTDLFNKNYHKCKHTHPEEFLGKEYSSQPMGVDPMYPINNNEFSADNWRFFADFIEMSAKKLNIKKSNPIFYQTRSPAHHPVVTHTQIPEINRMSSVVEKNFNAQPRYIDECKRDDPRLVSSTTTNLDAYRQESFRMYAEPPRPAMNHNGFSSCTEQRPSVFGAPGYLQRTVPMQSTPYKPCAESPPGKPDVPFDIFDHCTLWQSPTIVRSQKPGEAASWNFPKNVSNTFQDSSLKPFCPFCKSSGKPESVYTDHVMKDFDNRNLCPYLRKIICPLCHSTDPDTAHTLKYCPRYREHMLDEACAQRKNVI